MTAFFPLQVVAAAALQVRACILVRTMATRNSMSTNVNDVCIETKEADKQTQEAYMWTKAAYRQAKEAYMQTKKAYM